MTEMQQAVRMLSSLPLVLGKNPAGTWSFVGSVPVDLKYRQMDGSLVTDKQIATIKQCGAGLLKGVVKSLTFATKEAAIAEAEKFGATIKQVCD